MQRLSGWVLLLGSLSGLALAEPLDRVEQQRWLLEQVRIGEAQYREELVRDSLARLERIAPDDPETLFASLRLSLRKRDAGQAGRLLERLRRLAPDSPLLRHGEVLLRLHDAASQRTLQQARLLAAGGRREQARALYEQLFGTEPPDLALALEYWRLRAAIDVQPWRAIEQLRALDRQYPGNVALRQTLVDLLFAGRHNEEALRVLGQLAADPAARDAAAQREFDYLAELPLSRDSARAWQRFLTRYPDSSRRGDAQTRLQAQQRLLADPAWQAGQRGKRLLGQGEIAAAEMELRRALRRYPEDASLHGELGYALLRLGRHDAAYAALRQALAMEQDDSAISRWRDLMITSRYWMLVKQADQALDAGDSAAAHRLYREARGVKPGDAFALVGLGRVAQAQGDDAEAERLLLEAYRLDPASGNVIRAMVRLYRDRQPERAEALLASLPITLRGEFADSLRALRRERLEREAEAARARGERERAVALLEEAAVAAPDDPWLVYRLANTQRELGRDAAAEAGFQRLLQRQGDDRQARYAHGLYLSSAGRDEEALASLGRISPAAWDEDMRALAARLQRRQLLARAAALRAAGREDEAAALLLRDPLDEDLLRVAEWAAERNAPAQAERYYRQLLQRAPGHAEARLGLVESLIAGDRPDEAHALLRQGPLQLPSGAPNARRRLANAWIALGAKDEAGILFDELVQEVQWDPLLLRDAARLFAPQQPGRAIGLYAQAMAAAGLLTHAQFESRDPRALTRASRAREEDGWLIGSLRGDVDALYRRRNPTVHVHHEYGWRSDDATPGISDLAAQTSILQVDLPFAGGDGFLRAERVDLDVGSFDTDDSGRHHEEFGSCALQWRHRESGAAYPAGCRDGAQRARGTAVALGWSGRRWSFDVGHSPQGFEVGNWLGGVSHGGDWGELGWTLTASRRPLSNSLLSYAGAVDPQTGIRWGGVTANGFTLGLRHDQGGAGGVWASLGLHWLRGENVADNQRGTAMAGYYHRFLERVDERLRAGVSVMYRGYRHDLGEYTLGQGGYYSPRHYYSIGIPLSYARRNADWSVQFEGSFGWSQARSKDSELYPLRRMMAKLFDGRNPDDYVLEEGRLVNPGDSGGGTSLRLQASIERRLSDHLVLGGHLSWQHSEDYAPSRAMLYLRYTLEPWQGSLPLPVGPLTPYADFR